MLFDSHLIRQFNYNGKLLTVVLENDVYWFCRKELARCMNISNHYLDIYTDAKNKKKFKVKENFIPFNFINEDAVRNILSGKYTNLLIDPNFIPWIESEVKHNLKSNIDNNDDIITLNPTNNISTTNESNFPTFDFTESDTINENGNIFINLSKIGEILEISPNALRKMRTKKDWFDDDEIKICQPRPNGPSSINSNTYISESGFYRIINRTASPKARPFERYVSKVILPNVRKGNIIIQKKTLLPNLDDSLELKKALFKELEEKIEIAKQAQNLLKNNIELTTENQELHDKLGLNSDFKAVRSLRDRAKNFFDVTIDKFYSVLGKYLSKLSREKNIPIKQVASTTYGKVNAYSVDVIEEFFADVNKDKSILKEFRLKKKMVKGKLL